MGTRVDFYILSTSSEAERHNYACRLIEKAFHQGKKIHVQTSDQKHAHVLDDLLWSFKDTSFIPHAISLDTHHPITIGCSTTPKQHRILVNLNDNMPELSYYIERIIEILPSEGPATASGRERYKQYQQRQFEINTHKIGNKK